MRLVYSARTAGRPCSTQTSCASWPAPSAIDDTLTRDAPPQWDGRRGRIDAALLDEVGWSPESESSLLRLRPTRSSKPRRMRLVALGHEPAQIRTERFGPTGE